MTTETQDWEARADALLAESRRRERIADVVAIGGPIVCLLAAPWIGWWAVAGITASCVVGYMLNRRALAPLAECQRVLDAKRDQLNREILAACQP